eukprot:TRINITY_DN5924_c0_g1_i1.p1 TRINITY_DN5924_c0_g1~~TRINITY_DN5924_c0_g1_i1.p1  ORF type:complete len:1280 (-),score=178.58 TRINITY_DN5924_c0_g1_i1:531-4370(-)
MQWVARTWTPLLLLLATCVTDVNAANMTASVLEAEVLLNLVRDDIVGAVDCAEAAFEGLHTTCKVPISVSSALKIVDNVLAVLKRYIVFPKAFPLMRYAATVVEKAIELTLRVVRQIRPMMDKMARLARQAREKLDSLLSATAQLRAGLDCTHYGFSQGLSAYNATVKMIHAFNCSRCTEVGNENAQTLRVTMSEAQTTWESQWQIVEDLRDQAQCLSVQANVLLKPMSLALDVMFPLLKVLNPLALMLQWIYDTFLNVNICIPTAWDKICMRPFEFFLKLSDIIDFIIDYIRDLMPKVEWPIKFPALPEIPFLDFAAFTFFDLDWVWPRLPNLLVAPGLPDFSLPDIDRCQVCDEIGGDSGDGKVPQMFAAPLVGCNDATALNYNPDAAVANDSVCEYRCSSSPSTPRSTCLSQSSTRSNVNSSVDGNAQTTSEEKCREAIDSVRDVCSKDEVEEFGLCSPREQCYKAERGRLQAEGCTDLDSQCVDWALKGRCNVPSVLAYCPLSCLDASTCTNVSRQVRLANAQLVNLSVDGFSADVEELDDISLTVIGKDPFAEVRASNTDLSHREALEARGCSDSAADCITRHLSGAGRCSDRSFFKECPVTCNDQDCDVEPMGFLEKTVPRPSWTDHGSTGASNDRSAPHCSSARATALKAKIDAARASQCLCLGTLDFLESLLWQNATSAVIKGMFDWSLVETTAVGAFFEEVLPGSDWAGNWDEKKMRNLLDFVAEITGSQVNDTNGTASSGQVALPDQRVLLVAALLALRMPGSGVLAMSLPGAQSLDLKALWEEAQERVPLLKAFDYSNPESFLEFLLPAYVDQMGSLMPLDEPCRPGSCDTAVLEDITEDLFECWSGRSWDAALEEGMNILRAGLRVVADVVGIEIPEPPAPQPLRYLDAICPTWEARQPCSRQQRDRLVELTSAMERTLWSPRADNVVTSYCRKVLPMFWMQNATVKLLPQGACPSSAAFKNFLDTSVTGVTAEDFCACSLAPCLLEQFKLLNKCQPQLQRGTCDLDAAFESICGRALQQCDLTLGVPAWKPGGVSVAQLATPSASSLAGARNYCCEKCHAEGSCDFWAMEPGSTSPCYLRKQTDWADFHIDAAEWTLENTSEWLAARNATDRRLTDESAQHSSATQEGRGHEDLSEEEWSEGDIERFHMGDSSDRRLLLEFEATVAVGQCEFTCASQRRRVVDPRKCVPLDNGLYDVLDLVATQHRRRSSANGFEPPGASSTSAPPGGNDDDGDDDSSTGILIVAGVIVVIVVVVGVGGVAMMKRR